MNDGDAFSYAVVTPVRNEEANLQRLADCLREQTAAPSEWVIVDTGSDDGTAAVAARIAAQFPDTTVIALSDAHLQREAVVVRAFRLGVAALHRSTDVIVKLDADISFDSRYFEALLRRFADEPSLGIASGTCLEQANGAWHERHVTGDHAWGAARAYRTTCLADVSPLEERVGWDGIDAFRARVKGWRSTTFGELVFRHHRPEGRRDGRWAGWRARGRAAHYMGYRPTFLAVRAVHHACTDPFALALVFGWLRAALRREPRCPDRAALALLRREQRLRELPARVREAYGRGQVSAPVK
jgi:biofilm PGA synthesis N-glycosyltransferase PgaC